MAATKATIGTAKTGQTGDTVLEGCEAVEFRREKETKNTVKYEEQPKPGKPPVIGTLYIQKWVQPPERFFVNISF